MVASVRRFLAIAFVVALPCWAFAEELGPDAELEKEARNDILAPRFDLGIWTLVVFVVLLLVLRRLAWKPMLNGLQQREASIRAALQEAEKAREDARSLREKFDAEMKKAAQNAREIIEEARRDATRLVEEERTKAKAEIGAERDRVYRDLNMAKDQALQEIWRQATQLATLISSKALARQISVDDHRALLDEALAEMQGAAEERRAMLSGKA